MRCLLLTFSQSNTLLQSVQKSPHNYRYVAFDSLGYKLITGISVWSNPGGSNSLLQNISHGNSPNNQSTTRRSSETSDGSPGSRDQEGSGTAQELIVNSYQNLVQRYDSLVRNYQRLFMARHQLTNTPSTNTVCIWLKHQALVCSHYLFNKLPCRKCGNVKFLLSDGPWYRSHGD